MIPNAEEPKITITLENTSSEPAIYKFKTNKVQRYVVSPNQGINYVTNLR